jgi:hypothetical protein
MPHERWTTASGAELPSVDKFNIGTTIEHVAYVSGCLPAEFGLAVSASRFSTASIRTNAKARHTPPSNPPTSRWRALEGPGVSGQWGGRSFLS